MAAIAASNSASMFQLARIAKPGREMLFSVIATSRPSRTPAKRSSAAGQPLGSTAQS